jgi:hypothetical protein
MAKMVATRRPQITGDTDLETLVKNLPSPVVIERIADGLQITPKLPQQPPPRLAAANAKRHLLAARRATEARKLRDENRSISEIARELDVTERTVWKYLAAPDD